MRIAFFELKKWEEEYLRERLKGHKLYFLKCRLNSRSVSRIEKVDAIVSFIYSDLNNSVLSKLKKLKFIATMSTGYDHIDLKYCRSKGIKVSNVPFYGENTVAEHTFALILSLAKKMDQAIERTKMNNFSLKGLIGFDLKGKTLGVIGPGHIGQHVIQIAKGFEMNVLAYGRKRDIKLSKKLGFKWASLEKLFGESDIVTIHVPLNNGTKHLIGMKEVRLMKKDSYIINTSRGEIVENKALLYGLNKGILAGAGLDVLEGECEISEERELLDGGKEVCDWEKLMQNHMLLKDKNVIVTPHSAFYTREALERILHTTVENVKSFVRGKVKNRVN
jgi:D-lactate dehydrogenase